VIDVADPYDGYTRGTPVSAFIPAVLGACGFPAVSHGAEAVGPKYGATHRKVLRAAGINVDYDMQQALTQINNPESAWAYLDQKVICPSLHDLIPLRSQIVKRPVITTVEVLIGPVRGKKSTTLMTGYVHKPYPPVYTHLAKISGFDSAVLVRGVEGGVIPSLKQESKYFEYKNRGELTEVEIHPDRISIQQDVRAVPLPKLNAAKVDSKSSDDISAKIDTDQLAEEAAKVGVAALQGEQGPARDSLIYSTAIMLTHMGAETSIQASAEKVRAVLDSGKAFSHFQTNQEY
jgi:anthranilate phosphoribosyltransferase